MAFSCSGPCTKLMGTSGKFNIFTALIDPKVGNYVISKVSLSFFHYLWCAVLHQAYTNHRALAKRNACSQPPLNAAQELQNRMRGFSSLWRGFPLLLQLQYMWSKRIGLSLVFFLVSFSFNFFEQANRRESYIYTVLLSRSISWDIYLVFLGLSFCAPVLA